MSSGTPPVRSSDRLHGAVLVWIGALVLIGIIAFVVFAFVIKGDSNPEDNVIIAETATPTLPAPSLTPSLAPSPGPSTTRTKLPDIPAQTSTETGESSPVENFAFDLGIHVQETQPSVNESVMRGYMESAATQLNLNWVKVTMQWEYIEPQPGVLYWGIWDSVFRAAAEFDLNVMVTFTGSPLWARDPTADPALQGPPSDPTAFATFVAGVLRRYPDQIHAIELWDTMNFRQRWDSPGGLNAADYMDLARLAAVEARAVSPNIIVISGGLEPTGLNDGISVVDDFSYMDMLIAAGLLDVVDCVGVHHRGYNIGPDVRWDQVPADENAQYRGPFDNPDPSWSFSSTLITYANKIGVRGFTTPICVTEFGWAAAEDLSAEYLLNLEFALDNTLQEQGTWIVEAINLMENWDFVWLAFLWNMNAGPENAFDPANDRVAYSLIRPNYTFSPAWSAIAEMKFRNRPR